MIFIPHDHDIKYAICEHYWEPDEDAPQGQKDADTSIGYTTPGFYFFDETQVNVYGPYLTYSSCCAHASKYGRSL